MQKPQSTSTYKKSMRHSVPNIYTTPPPQAVEVERSVLGSIIINSSVLNEHFNLLKSDYFYNNCNKLIFDAITSLHIRNAGIDIILLIEELKRLGNIDIVGGDMYIAELITNISTSVNLKSHIKILKDKCNLRELIQISMKIQSECYDPECDVESVIQSAESDIFKFSLGNEKNEPRHIRDLAFEMFQDLDDYRKNSQELSIKTGFDEADTMTTGLREGELIVLAARPGCGKTSLALTIALNIAIREQYKKSVLFFSLEMSSKQIMHRIASMHSKVELQKLRICNLNKQDLKSLIMSTEKFEKTDIFIDDSPSINLLEIRTKARKLKVRGFCDIIIIDYIQLMDSVEKGLIREQEISKISRGLKCLAKELKIPIIALSQLSRECDKRADHRPQLSDLRESGAIEQDADVVMFIHRPSLYNKDDVSLKGIAELIIGKQRNGPTGSVKLAFEEEIAWFSNLSNRDDGHDVF